jgi:hypothetical protein
MKTPTRKPYRTSAALLLAAALSFFALPASGQEMLVNGKLDTTAAGWQQVNGAVAEWGLDPTRDATGSSLSGSLEIVHVWPELWVSAWIRQCLDGIQPGEGYFLGGSLRFREGESSHGFAKVLAHFYSEPGCKGSYLGGAGSNDLRPQIDGRGIWLRVQGGTPTSGFAAPPGVKSVSFSVFVLRTQGEELTVNADDLYFAPVGTPTCDKLPATIIGTTGPDVLPGTAASDVIVGLGGADQIDGKAGNDRICGGPGMDTLQGGFGDDRLFGNGGGDFLYGLGDDDYLNGGAGADHIYGGPGSDVLKGGAGNDSCDGSLDFDTSPSGCETKTSIP